MYTDYAALVQLYAKSDVLEMNLSARMQYCSVIIFEVKMAVKATHFVKVMLNITFECLVQLRSSASLNVLSDSQGK